MEALVVNDVHVEFYYIGRMIDTLLDFDNIEYTEYLDDLDWDSTNYEPYDPDADPFVDSPLPIV